jgi:hypothetical protein
MRVSDGTLRLNAPNLALRRQEPRWKLPARGARVWWLGRLLRRQEPTTFHRCLAIHIHYAGPHSALS